MYIYILHLVLKPLLTDSVFDDSIRAANSYKLSMSLIILTNNF